MSLLARQIAAIGFQEWLSREGAPHGFLIDILLLHPVFEDRGKEARDAGVTAGSFQLCPSGYIFFEGDGDVSQ
jgi:hypothetical protein